MIDPINSHWNVQTHSQTHVPGGLYVDSAVSTGQTDMTWCCPQCHLPVFQVNNFLVNNELAATDPRATLECPLRVGLGLGSDSLFG